MPDDFKLDFVQLYLGNNETCRNTAGTNDVHIIVEDIPYQGTVEMKHHQFSQRGKKFCELLPPTILEPPGFAEKPAIIRDGFMKIGNTIPLRHGGGSKVVPVFRTSRGTIIFELVE